MLKDTCEIKITDWHVDSRRLVIDAKWFLKGYNFSLVSASFDPFRPDEVARAFEQFGHRLDEMLVNARKTIS